MRLPRETQPRIKRSKIERTYKQLEFGPANSGRKSKGSIWVEKLGGRDSKGENVRKRVEGSHSLGSFLEGLE